MSITPAPKKQQYYEAVDKHGEEKYAYEHKEVYSPYGDEYKESYYGYGGPSKVRGGDWHRRGGGGEGRTLTALPHLWWPGRWLLLNN